MMKEISIVLLAVLGALLLAGCWPFQWAATEPIKRATESAVVNVEAAQGRASPAVKPYLDESREALTTVVQPYVGLPEQPVKPLDLITGEKEDISQAQLDARRPPPTPGDVATAGLGVVDRLLNIGLIVAGTGVLGGGTVGAVRMIRKVKRVTPAIPHLVGAIDIALDGSKDTADLKEYLKEQPEATQNLVALAKVENRVRRNGDPARTEAAPA